MRAYHRLTEGHRNQIYALKKAGFNQSAIAGQIGVHKSTISRELRRNNGLLGYRVKRAHRLACMRKHRRLSRISALRWRKIERMIRLDWGPEQISGHLKVPARWRVSHGWIYQRIYADKRSGGSLHTHLRCQKCRRKRYGTIERRGRIKGRVCISERPGIVDRRARIGDWEIDTMIGKLGGALLVTMTERKSRYLVVVKARNKTANAVCAAITDALLPLANRVHTLTYDNGLEFSHHKRISNALNTKAYFAHPYHSWERGLNETTNGLIRQYTPKGKDIAILDAASVLNINERLNNRPRKCLGFKTPKQVFYSGPINVALGS